MPPFPRRLLDLTTLRGEGPQVVEVVGQRVIAIREPGVAVPESRRHVEQVRDRDLGEPLVALKELRQIVGDRIVDAADGAFRDGDPDQCGDVGLGNREGGGDGVALEATEVAFVQHDVVLDDDEGLGPVLLEEGLPVIAVDD